MNSEPSIRMKWLIALRPQTFSASLCPVLFGTLMAVALTGMPLKIGLFCAALAAMVCLHFASNMLNDVFDYRHGIDVRATPWSGAIVRDYLSDKAVLRAALALLALGCAIGCWIAWQVGLPVLILGMVGVLLGVSYTAGPYPLKYHAMGDAAIFFAFGMLGCLGSWIVQTGSFSWIPVVWSLPMSLLITGILHANNWRDIGVDRRRNIKTMASLLGSRSSQLYYSSMIFGAFAVVLVLMGLYLLPRAQELGMPWSFALSFLALPLAVKLHKQGLRYVRETRTEDIIALDNATGQLTVVFSLLTVLALGVMVWW